MLTPVQRVKGVALRSAAALRLSRRRSCAAVAGRSHRVAASGGQGGPGGLRFPPRPSLDSPLPLETPPLRYGDGGGGALRSGAALCLVAKGWGCSAFFRCLAGCVVRSCAALGCGSSHVAASGGQGGPGGLRFPPRPSLDSPLPLETPPLRYGDGGGRARRSGAALCRRGKGWCALLCVISDAGRLPLSAVSAHRGWPARSAGPAR